MAKATNDALTRCLALIVAILAGFTWAQSAETDERDAPPPVEIAKAHSYAGAVKDELFVAVDVLVPADPGQRRLVAAYLCDGRNVSQWLSGELTAGDTTLTAGGWTVEVTVAGERAYGTVAHDDDLPDLFTAPSTGEGAGLFRAAGTEDGTDYVGGWIELGDGRQRGALTMAGAIVANPSADVTAGEVATADFGTLSLCCCGVAFPCSLDCCAVDPAELLAPSATPSPN